MAEYATRMIAAWPVGEPRPLRPELMRLSLQIAAKIILGLDSTDPRLDEIEAALQATLRLFDNPAQLDVAIPTRDKKRFYETVPRLDDLIFDLIRERRAAGAAGPDVLSQLLTAPDETGHLMPDQQLRDEVVTLLRASHKNSPIVLQWVWYLLAQHPEVEARLVAELDRVLAGRLPGFVDLPHLPYTEMVIKETMRLYPLYPLVGREAVQPWELEGCTIPAGNQVLVSAWLLHRDPRFWEQPDRFWPERWINDLEKHLPKYAYFPFGGGPRLCIVKSYAMMELLMVVATIAQKRHLQLTPGYRLKLFHAFSGLRPKQDLPAIPVRR